MSYGESLKNNHQNFEVLNERASNNNAFD